MRLLGGMVALDHQKVAGLVGVLQHIHVEAPHESIPELVVGELGDRFSSWSR